MASPSKRDELKPPGAHREMGVVEANELDVYLDSSKALSVDATIKSIPLT